MVPRIASNYSFSFITFLILELQSHVFDQTSSKGSNKLRSLIEERFHLIFCQHKIFTIVASLPEFDLLRERPRDSEKRPPFTKCLLK